MTGYSPGNPERSEASLDIIEGMINDLHAYDPQTFQSKGQTGAGGYWHPNMFWYGPAGIGSNYTYPGFDKDHRIPFLTAFPDRKGGNHYCRIGDGGLRCHFRLAVHDHDPQGRLSRRGRHRPPADLARDGFLTAAPAGRLRRTG